MKYKLTYFDTRARAEPIRLLFVVAGKKFDDVRITTDQWKSMKKSTPQGMLPILEVQGKGTLLQSNAIARYLAKKFGFYGENEEDEYNIDKIMDTVNDIVNPFEAQNLPYLVLSQKDAPYTRQMVAQYHELVVKPGLQVLESLLTLNRDGKEYFVGNEISLADLYVFDKLQTLENVIPNTLENHNKLKKFVKRISKHTKLENYFKNRKHTIV
ncbi:hypothetical protein SNEBB_006370 [Seison nebaliae]|nr:hypothetical protein SNEBB_006370 [Seison nebaliae]